MSQVAKITDGSFEQDVLNADKPVLVDFWAEWCGPCKALSPVLDELAKEIGDKVTVAKINIDENPMSPSKYGVRGIPTLMVFEKGTLKATKVGGASKQDLIAWIQSNL